MHRNSLMPSEIEHLRNELVARDDVDSLDPEGFARLHAAARDADAWLVKMLVDIGANTSAQTKDGDQPLHLAAASPCFAEALDTSIARIGIMRVLLSAGANIEAKNHDGDTPLALAYYHDFSLAVAFLLRAGANPNSVGERGLRTPNLVVRLVRDGNHPEIIASLIKAGSDVNAKDEHGDTLLNHAAWLGSQAGVLALLQAGADPNIEGRSGYRSIHFAVRMVHPAIDYGGTMLLGEEETSERRADTYFADQSADFGVLQALVDAGADINAHGSTTIFNRLFGSDVDTPIICAAKAGLPETVLWLLRAGADLKIHDTTHRSLLHFSGNLIEGPGSPELLKALLDSGLDINGRAKSGDTPLLCAAEAGSPAAVRWLIQAGANPNIPGSGSRSPLHFASRLIRHADGPGALDALVKAGANLNSQGDDGGNSFFGWLLSAVIDTPLISAIKDRSPAAVLWLLEAGADPNIVDVFEDRSPLHFASDLVVCLSGCDAVKALLSSGLEVDALDRSGETPLCLAAKAASPSAVLLLLEAGAKSDCVTLEMVQKVALVPDGADAVAALLKAGWDDGFLHANGTLPMLHRAARLGFPAVISIIIRTGADPNSTAGNGDRPLHYAVEAPRATGDEVDAIELLISAGANVDASGLDGASPLHRAASLGIVTAVHILLKMGADPNVRDVRGRTPLHYAVESGLKPEAAMVTAALVEGGSDVNATSSDGQTPVYLGLLLCSASAVHVLLEKGARLPDYQRYGDTGELLDIMTRYRRDMLSLPTSEHGHHIAVLYTLHSKYQEFPSYPLINEFEVKRVQSKPSSSGGFGDCWEGVFLGQQRVAMKCLRGHGDEDSMKKKLDREVRVWKNLRHPHILQFIGLGILGSTTYMLSPWMDNGNVLEYLSKNTSEDRLRLLLHVALGIQYLHNFDPIVVHGDLKGSNIFVSSSGDAVIADFGLSEMILAGAEQSNSTTFYTAGSRRWQAPELIQAETKAQAQRTTASDIFAFGRVMAELYTLQVPFAEVQNEAELIKKITARELPRRPKDSSVVARGFDDHLWALIKDCCRYEPGRRPSANVVVARLQGIEESRARGTGGRGGFRASVRRHVEGLFE